MSVDAGTINAEVRLLLEDLKKDVLKVEKNLSGIANTSKTVADKSTKSFFSLKQVLVGIGGIGAFGILFKGLKSLASLSIEQTKVEQQLAQRIKSTGGAAGLTADEVKRMATELQRVTTFGDETIIGAQNLLLTFTKIGKDVFPLATETVLDMSQALGQDLKSSAIQLGKALNDPITGAAALKRVGVSLTDQQLSMIKTFQDSGDIISAQKVVLNELAVEFGGSARAAAAGVGAYAQAKNVLGDLGETIGKKLAKPLAGAASLFSNITRAVIDNIYEEKSLDEVTKLLISSTAEYSKVSKLLEGDLTNVTKAEKLDLEVKKSKLSLDVISNLRKINVLYEDQQRQLPFLESKLKKEREYAQLLKEQITSTGRYSDQIVKNGVLYLKNISGRLVAVGTFEKRQENLNNSKVAEAEILLKINNLNAEYESSLTAIAGAVSNNVISIDSLIGVNDKAKLKILEIIEALRLKSEATVGDTTISEEATAEQISLLEEYQEKLMELSLSEIELNNAKIEKEREKAIVLADGNVKAIEAINKYYDALKNKEGHEQALKNDKELAEARIQIFTSVANSITGIFSDIFDIQSSLAKEGSKKEIEAKKRSFIANKAAQITELTISGIVSAIKAFNTSVDTFGLPAGPIIGGILAALIGVKTATGIVKIGAQKPNFKFGGVVPGTRSMGVDSVPINASPKEVVLTEAQQSEFLNIANGGGNGSQPTILNIVTNSGEILRSWIFNETKNRTLQVHGNGIIDIGAST